MVSQKDPLLAARIAEAVLKESPPGHFEFHFVGDGPLRSDCEALLNRLVAAGDVVFHGEINDARPLISELDLLLMTSRAEGLPLTALEAMSFGVPVVATNVPGLSDVAEAAPGACVLFAHGDVSSGSRAVQSLQDIETWQGASRSALAAARDQFSLDATIEHLARVYLSAVRP